METIKKDYLVLGGGPAGLQLGYFLQRQDRDYLILERGEKAGTFFETMPRHRKLLSINKVYTGYKDRETQLRWDWNSLLSDDDNAVFSNHSKKYFPSAEALVDYLRDFASRLDLRVRYECDVVQVDREGEQFRLETADGQVYLCNKLIIATGMPKPFTVNIPGVELTENYADCPIDPEDYADQRVLIVGKGNSGFEMADSLVETTRLLHIVSPDPLKFAWQSHFVGHLRAVNNNLLDTYLLKGQNTVIDADIEKIEKVDDELRVHMKLTAANGHTAVFAYDRVVMATGFAFDHSIFAAAVKPEMRSCGRLPLMTAKWESTNVPGLFFAGTIMQCRDYKKTMSSFIHGFRHNVETLSQFLAERYHGEPMPTQRIENGLGGLVDAIIERISTCAPLFLQPGFLCDAIVIHKDGGAEMYCGVPVDWIRESAIGQEDHYYLVTLEFGDYQGDPFFVERTPAVDEEQGDAFLHPVIRRYRGSERVETVHISDHLENDWRPGGNPDAPPVVRAMQFVGLEDPYDVQTIYRRKLHGFMSQFFPTAATSHPTSSEASLSPSAE